MFFSMATMRQVEAFIKSNPSDDQLKLVIPADHCIFWDAGEEHEAAITFDLAANDISVEGDPKMYRDLCKEIGRWHFWPDLHP